MGIMNFSGTIETQAHANLMFPERLDPLRIQQRSVGLNNDAELHEIAQNIP